ncbi:hypothetical protein [Myroides sp. N17-2]|uniref:hypothetical protein n=1 Tax=Myroides sp. N17-2 TaxID=2030799 RepID=UPI00117C5477|nr:hypothetical protein [Myroides sp. N17-2]
MRYLYLSFILILSHLGMAQNLSKEEFVKAVNTIGVYCVNTSRNEDSKDDFKGSVIPTKDQTLEGYKAKFVDTSNTYKLINEFISLRDSKDFTQFNTVDYLNGKAGKNIFNNSSYQTIVTFFSKENRKQNYTRDFSELKRIYSATDKNSGVTTDTTNDLTQTQAQDTTVAVSDPLPTSDVEDDITVTPTTEPKVEEIGFFEIKPLSVGLTLGVVLGFIGAFFLLKKVGSSDDKKEDSKYKIDRPTSSPVNDTTAGSSDLIKYQEDIKKLQEENRQLLAKMTDLEKLEQAIVQPKEQMIEEIVSAPIELEVVAPVPTKSVKYYSIPNQDGIFTAEKSRESSIYSVEYINNNEGIFYIDISDRYLQDAIFEMSTFIDCGCEYTATPSSSTKGIRVLQTGSVINEGGNWRIVEKCKIEFV